MTLAFHLATLESSGLIHLAQAEPELEYLFRHALVQDAAYEAMLKADRRLLHRAVGEALKRLYPERVDELAPLLSHHFVKSGEYSQALTYTKLAAEKAIQQYANEEAVMYLTRALDILENLPSDIKHDRAQVILQTMLGSSYLALQGEASDAAFQTFSHTLELCERRQMHARAFPLQAGLIACYFARAQVADARNMAEKVFEFAQHHSSPLMNSWTYWAMGVCAYESGELAFAREMLARAAQSPRPPHLISAIYDAKVHSLGLHARGLGLLGYFDQALRAIQTALQWAKELNQPFSLVHVYLDSAFVHQSLGDVENTWQWAETVIRFSSDREFRYHVAFGMIFQGWALGKQGNIEKGVAQIQAGLKLSQDTQIFVFRSYYLSLLADVYRLAGKIADGLEVINRALAFVESSGERFYEAELCRRKGELLITQGNTEGEKWFRTAIEVARRQQAKALELRATLSLCRWLAQQGHREEAQQQLVEIYQWFTEGLGTLDLQDAKLFLDELS